LAIASDGLIAENDFKAAIIESYVINGEIEEQTLEGPNELGL
jgi:hypothetical protein